MMDFFKGFLMALGFTVGLVGFYVCLMTALFYLKGM